MWRVSDGCEGWRRRYREGLLRRSMIHTRQSPSGFYCGIIHLQNIFQCTCIRYNLVLFVVFISFMFWVSHLTNQNNVTTFYIIRKNLLFSKTFNLSSSKTCKLKHISINVSVLPPISPLSPTLILTSFVSNYMNQPGTVMHCFYETWRFCSLLNAIQWYNLYT